MGDDRRAGFARGSCCVVGTAIVDHDDDVDSRDFPRRQDGSTDALDLVLGRDDGGQAIRQTSLIGWGLLWLDHAALLDAYHRSIPAGSCRGATLGCYVDWTRCNPAGGHEPATIRTRFPHEARHPVHVRQIPAWRCVWSSRDRPNQSEAGSSRSLRVAFVRSASWASGGYPTSTSVKPCGGAT